MCSSSEGVHSIAKEKIHKKLAVVRVSIRPNARSWSSVSDPRAGAAHGGDVCPQLPHTCAPELIYGTDVSSSNSCGNSDSHIGVCIQCCDSFLGAAVNGVWIMLLKYVFFFSYVPYWHRRFVLLRSVNGVIFLVNQFRIKLKSWINWSVLEGSCHSDISELSIFFSEYLNLIHHSAWAISQISHFICVTHFACVDVLNTTFFHKMLWDFTNALQEKSVTLGSLKTRSWIHCREDTSNSWRGQWSRQCLIKIPNTGLGFSSGCNDSWLRVPGSVSGARHGERHPAA